MYQTLQICSVDTLGEAHSEDGDHAGGYLDAAVWR